MSDTRMNELAPDGGLMRGIRLMARHAYASAQPQRAASPTKTRGGDVAETVGPAGRMRIGRVLFVLRDRAGLTQTEVAAQAGVSVGTVNRYEGWQDRSKLRLPTVRSIADACGATSSERDALVRLVTSQEEGWWLEHPALPDIISPLVSFEAYATYERVWASQLVPGLLQTPEYDRALHRATQPQLNPDEIEATVKARGKRQEVLNEQGLHLSVVLKASVLDDVVGTPEVMRDQITHLINMSERPNVELRVLPRRYGHLAGSGGHFVHLGRDNEADPLASMSVVYLELHHRGLYLDAPDDVSKYSSMFDYLLAAAADAESSRELLERARQEHTT
ncbi:helix-turn-helix domain-containing protein [Streptomyces sp. NPDC020412]|uniref:helix-turn-helix domain-containing protein n=1 Tax=Streptomyces sp. NPDC020412 TaxID=3365073 RepID=UPI0037B34DE3